MTPRDRQWLRHYFQALGLIGGALAILLGLAVLVNRPVANRPKPASQPAPVTYTFADGSRQPFPGNRFVALYGAPGDPVLGALGEQGPAQAAARIKALAAGYDPLSEEPVMPAFEIITTVAAAEPTANNDFSRETEASTLRPRLDEARRNGIYVLLDLQPGTTDFETQAKQYADLLRQPHVGLALDPEWRLQPGKKHLEDIGSVSAEEVNRTSGWLARLVRDNGLPPKLFVLHQFRASMLTERSAIQERPELASVIQMDGQGAQDLKRQTYAAITSDPPPGVRFGWKNFYRQDTPMLTPAETMQQRPLPWLISYQ